MNNTCFIASTALVVACTQAPSSPPETVRFEVTTAKSRPVIGAHLAVDGTPLGVTGTEGTLEVRLETGAERHQVELRCPEHHTPSESLRSITLRRTFDLEGQPLVAPIRLECEPTHVAAAVVVRTSPPAELPVLIQGENVGKTGPDGLFHFLAFAARQSSLRVELDTSSRPDLRLSTPARTFTLADEDTVLPFDATFVPAERKKKSAQRAPRPRHIPYRLD
jgi:hypothetical protein